MDNIIISYSLDSVDINVGTIPETVNISISETAGAKGDKGDTGNTGAQGIQGPIGLTGLQGPDGEQGLGFIWIGVWSPSYVYQIQDCVQYLGSSYVCTQSQIYNKVPTEHPSMWSLMTQIGNTGPTGPQGIKGDTGSTGSTGAQGIQGPAGSDASVNNTNVLAAIGYTPLNINQTTPQTTTGRLTFPNIAIDTNTIYTDSVNHRVGIGTVTPQSKIQTLIGALGTSDIINSASFTTSDFSIGSAGGLLTISAEKSSPNNYDINQISATRSGGTSNGVLKLQSGRGKVSIGATEPTQQLHTTENVRMALSAHEQTDSDGNIAYGVIYKGTLPFLHNFNYGLNSSNVTTLGGNTFLGLDTGNFTMGSSSTNSTYASKNTIVGANSFKNATNAYDNTGFGFGVFGGLSNGYYNAAFGNEALKNLVSGRDNVAIGNNALFNTTASYNTVIGSNAGYNLGLTGQATMIGYNAGRYYTSGTTNLTGAANSTFIGQESRASANNNTNEIVIGYNTVGNGTNTVTIGNTNVTANYFNGTVQATGFKTATGTASQFLKANGSIDSVTYEPTISTKKTAFNKDFGTTAGTVLEGRTFGSAANSSSSDFATLVSGKIPLTQIPDSIVGQLEYQGVWNAAGGSFPTGTLKGQYWVSNSDGTSAMVAYKTGDWLVYNGTTWDKVDNTDAVATVNGLMGAVILNSSAISHDGTLNAGVSTMDILDTVQGDITGYATSKENSANKSIDGTFATNVDDTHYPSVQAVKTYIDTTAAAASTAVTFNCKNTSGADITNKLVYISGSASSLPKISLASNDSETKSDNTIGYVNGTIANGGTGTVYKLAFLSNQNTNSWNDGDRLWLGLNGVLTNVRPVPPLHAVFVGWVVDKSATVGKIVIDIQNGFELDELHDVLTSSTKTTPINEDSILLQDSTDSSLWKRLTWLNNKASLKTYFDTLYPSGSGSSNGTNNGDIALSANSGLGLVSGQSGLALGTPTTITSSTTNAVTANTHSHALTVTKSDVSLGNVDNTSDANKPVSTAQATSIATKADAQGTILYHTTALTSSGTIGISGSTVTGSGTSFTTSMVNARLTVAGINYIIATAPTATSATITTTATVASGTPYAIYARSIAVLSTGIIEFYKNTDNASTNKLFDATTGSGLTVENIRNFSDYFAWLSTELMLNSGGKIEWASGTNARTTKDVGLRRSAAGTLEIYDGITAISTTPRDLALRNLIVDKTAGSGIKVDIVTPTFGWKDLVGPINTRVSGGTAPIFKTYIGGIYQYGCGTVGTCEVFNEYHLPHDYLTSSNMFIHTHWSTIIPPTGNINWMYEISYAKGYDQAAFSTPVIVGVQQTSTSAFKHMIAEVQFTGTNGLIPITTIGSITSGTNSLTIAGAPFTNSDIGRTVRIIGAGVAGANLDTTISSVSSTSTVILGANASTTVTNTASMFNYRVLDVANIEPDGLLLVRTYRQASNDTLNVEPFLHTIDVHYQSTQLATKSKNYPFYT